MNRLLLLMTLASAVLAPIVGRGEAPGPAGPATPLDLRGLRPHEARVDPLPGAAGAVRVTFQPAEWPSVNLAAPGGRAWDWSSRGYLLLELRNPEDREVALGIRIDDDPAADGRTHCRTAQVTLQARETATVAVALKRADPMAHGMRGLPSYPGTRTVTASGSGPFNLGHVVAFQTLPPPARTPPGPGAPIGPARARALARGHRRPARPVRRGGLAGQGSIRIGYGRSPRARGRRPQGPSQARRPRPVRGLAGRAEAASQRLLSHREARRQVVVRRSRRRPVPLAGHRRRDAERSDHHHGPRIDVHRIAQDRRAAGPLLRNGPRDPFRAGQGGQDLQLLRGQPGTDLRSRP